MTNIVRLGEGEETTQVFGSKYTTHPITDFDGAYFIDVIKEDYAKAGIEVINIRTYYNSGYNHVTGKKDKPEEFGIEVEHL